MDIVYLIAGIIGGTGITWLIFHFYTKSKNLYTPDEMEAFLQEKKELEVKLGVAEGTLKSQAEENDVLRADMSEIRE